MFITKEDIKKLAFSDKETSNELSQKSFVQNFLSSLRDKMYKKRSKRKHLDWYSRRYFYL